MWINSGECRAKERKGGEDGKRRENPIRTMVCAGRCDKSVAGGWRMGRPIGEGHPRGRQRAVYVLQH